MQSREDRGRGPRPTHTRLLRRIADAHVVICLIGSIRADTVVRQADADDGQWTANSTRRRRRRQEQF